MFKANIASPLSFAFWGLTAVFFVLTVIGAINHYTPVPFWDMWDGNVSFYTRLLDGDMSAWWEQHVNHRTIFSNVLFYIDHKFFSGHNYFLIVSHFILMACLVLWFRLMLSEGASKNDDVAKLNWVILAVIAALSYCWIQADNITWAFQSQMFATNLFPAFSFYFIYKSSQHAVKTDANIGYTIASVLCGFVSAFTMMNGILALPLLLVLAILLKCNRVAIAVIFVVMIVTLKLYFTGYVSPDGQGNMVETILSQPLDILKFSFMFLGAPIFYLTGNGIIALLAGIVMAGLFSFLLYKLLTQKSIDPRVFVLMCLLAYEAATIGGIAGGRLIHGINQAFESRYMTTSLFISSLLVLMSALVFRETLTKKPKLVWAYLLIPVLLLPAQLKALDMNINRRYQTLISALALELQVKDPGQLLYLWPDMDILYILSAKARLLDQSIFGHSLYTGIREDMGREYSNSDQSSVTICNTYIPIFENVDGDDGFSRLIGSISMPGGVEIPRRLAITDKSNTVIGYAITETKIPAVRWPGTAKNTVTIFGYAVNPVDPTEITLKTEGVECGLRLHNT